MHVVDGADAPADGEGHEAAVGGTFDHGDHGLAAVSAGGDVEEDHFIGTLIVVADREFDWIADIFQFTGFGTAELHTTSDLACMHIEAGDDTLCQVALHAID